ncbi:tRNA (guanosine(18)-2'-O)-methyltransferase TrmH [Natronospira bacteriovora]|uniref:tRNA (guanosine(18)-2'-O)-methyltransferase n=1 Tax=Natronospira bacteriovora TaxID=3069753 RepID=A0ABU0W4R6_9GAMM|nr:tRNA (guanosine(18)-2'-O)-methyltransferase TrmH [Natronospira sp. AB-CW4]MDQ2068903.1 tRNA (guanosine(18)-2'-O)-methyltransferase TrmH [Natronospira sp. AB-CW4]
MTPERLQKLHDTLNRRQPDLTVLMDDVHKSHNLSAVMRTADAVGIQDIHAVSPDRSVQRYRIMSGGSRKWVATHIHPDIPTAADKLKASGHRIVAAHFSPRARDFREVDYTRPTALLLGNELSGVSEQGSALADEHVIIPMLGMVASLNVSVAAALILYEAQRQRLAAGLYEHCRLPPERYRQLLFEWAYPRIARYCRDKRLPYPPLDEHGLMQEAPGTRVD